MVTRRAVLRTGAAWTLASGVAVKAGAARAAADATTPADYLPREAKRLRQLYDTLAALPRKRGFSRLPMILTRPGEWDSEPLDTVLAYPGNYKQVFDTTDIGSTWLSQIRNTVNAEVFALGHPNFLAVAAPHGPAGFTLLTNAAWQKYDIAALTNDAFQSNTTLADPPYNRAAVDDPQKHDGLYSDAGGNYIPVLQKRGVVFMACHNALWELAETLIARGINPDGGSAEALVAALTASLIPGVITTPGNEATIGMCQQAGFRYSFASD
jgi:hypothetical protein